MPAILYWVVILTSARLLLATIAMRRVAESEELRAGKITLQGEVLAEDESTPPVAVEIEQEGTEWFVKKKKRWAHGWKENGRRVTAKPFRLLLASGEIVDIMAGDRATVAVPLSGEPHGECKHRTLRAEICHGQRIYAHGMLAVPTETLGSDEAGSAYRDTPPSRPILRAPDDEQLWLGS